MLNDFFVSVIMPAFNCSKFIRRAINSVLVQTHQNFEFIIVDDGSTDDTAAVINSYTDPRIKYIHQENVGPVYAYNRGLKEATGNYIFIHDHDDRSAIDRFEKQLKYMIENYLDVCGTFYSVLNKKRGFIERIELPINHSEIRKELLFRPWTIFNPTICVKQEVFNRYGFFDCKMNVGYDYAYWLRISDFVRFGNLPECLYDWTINKNSYGSINESVGYKAFQKIALEKLNISKVNYRINEIFFFRGMIYFNSNSFLKASISFFVSILNRNFSAKIFFFFILSSFFSPIVYLLRRYQLFSHPFIVKLKSLFDDFH